MDCFDSVNGLNALTGASLIVAGTMLMSISDKMAQGYGTYVFTLGYIILGLAAVALDVSSLLTPSVLMIRRVSMVMGSVALILAGKLLGYYTSMNNNPNVLPSGNVTAQSVYKSMVYLGAAGFVLSVSYDRYGFNMVKALLTLGAVLAIGFSSNAISNSSNAAELSKNRWLNLGSWGALVLVVASACPHLEFI